MCHILRYSDNNSLKVGAYMAIGSIATRMPFLFQNDLSVIQMLFEKVASEPDTGIFTNP